MIDPFNLLIVVLICGTWLSCHCLEEVLRQLQKRTYLDGYKDGLDMGLQFIKKHNKLRNPDSK